MVICAKREEQVKPTAMSKRKPSTKARITHSRGRAPLLAGAKSGTRFEYRADGRRTIDYGKNDPLRSWPISANELEEVAMGSETNV